MTGDPSAMTDVGLPTPRTLRDVGGAMWAAQDRLDRPAAARLGTRDHYVLELARQKAKSGGRYGRGRPGSPHLPAALDL